jgi:hypothetical protein
VSYASIWVAEYVTAITLTGSENWTGSVANGCKQSGKTMTCDLAFVFFPINIGSTTNLELVGLTIAL